MYLKSNKLYFAGIDKRGIGGFGVHITKNIVDILEYERMDNKNILTITKYL